MDAAHQLLHEEEDDDDDDESSHFFRTRFRADCILADFEEGESLIL